MRAFYSALFTDKDNPSDKLSSFKPIDGWDYILFTNLDIKSNSWTIRKIEPPNSDFVISAKMIKWLSHKYLSEYDMVYWMDAYCIFNPEKESILKSTISRLEDATIPLFIKKHPSRNCIYNELTACLEFKKINLEMYEKVKKFLLDNAVPRDYGLYETISMIKLHKDKKVINISEEIIELIKKLTYRDQLILTAILYKHHIKSLGFLNPELLICNTKNINHNYFKEDPRRIALCFFGLTRSLKFTLSSIKKNILDPLSKDNIEYDIFLHTYKVKKPYTNPRAGETRIHLNSNEYKLLKPDHFLIEDKEEVSKEIQLEKYRTHGDPWGTESTAIPGNYTTLDNHILYLWSQKQLTKMWSKELDRRGYTHIVFCRPDVQYLTPLEKHWFSFTTNIILIPTFGQWHGINDRFAIGRPDQMKIYGNRFNESLEYSKHHKLASELFLRDTLKKHKINVDSINMFFIRIRANMKKERRDISQIKTLKQRLKEEKNKTRKKYFNTF